MMKSQGIDISSLNIPQPASTMPPPVDATSAVGVLAPYARADHTHKSSVQAARLAVAGGSGQFSWTFPVPFPAGTNPVITATVENPSGTQPFVVNLASQPSNTAATFKVFAGQSVALNLTIITAGLNLAPFVNSGNGIFVNVIARLPTQ